MSQPKRANRQPHAGRAARPRNAGTSLVLEIGTEELPSNFVPRALSDLSDLGRAVFQENRLGYESLRTVGTPRRLALLVDGVQARQQDLTQELFGPPKSAAYDSVGNPTKAALGFASAQGVRVEELQLKETSKGWYVSVNKRESGKPAKEVLSHVLPELLQRLGFQKSMRWNSSRVRFARPIRWLTVVFGKQSLPLEFAGVRASAWSYGHRFFKKGKTKGKNMVLVSHAAKYLELLERVGVIVDPDSRRTIIQRQIQQLAKKAKGQLDPLHEEELVAEAVYGVENPKAIVGSFPQKYLLLPKPVLISSMKEHQGFFAVWDEDGSQLLPKFIAVTNMPWGNLQTIIKGNERVLSARLHDAQYFYNEDTKCPLWEKVEALKGVVLHHKLGTVYQKVRRMEDLIGWLTKHLQLEDLKKECERAALLSKADLVTGMVGEFPTLQGIMGQFYVDQDPEEKGEGVAEAIGEHYLPRFPEDQLPESLPGALLAMADRCDTITAFFAAGMSPSGSEDPLGLRRSAFGLVRIIAETPFPSRVNLVSVIQEAVRILNQQGMVKGDDGTVQQVLDFILERLRYLGRSQKFGFQDDVMEAVIKARPQNHCDIRDLLSRMAILQSMLREPDFGTLMIGFKRAHRIVDKEQWDPISISPERFREPQESGLFQALEDARSMVEEAIHSQQYGRALHNLLKLKAPIDDFFDKVMVNDKDPGIRANRLSLLWSIDQLFLSYADFSCLSAGG